ncbi:hypothetical protein [uncultured Microscilla sp.]|uniref:hypothetical protein n=1 Tax=uncultured Microscilla sp. TaxID=432653 RepID=UPI002608A332|nr:hypothetical protein [uncultured Microscilla sp.]
MSQRKIQFIFSLLFLLSYIGLLVIILVVEISDHVNMKKGSNSMMGEIKVLLGVLTGGVGQILNFWFQTSKDTSQQDKTT